MSESWQISSLPEFLESMECKTFDEAKDHVQAEYASVSRMIEEVRRARKTGNPSRVHPASSKYFPCGSSVFGECNGRAFFCFG